MLQVRRQKGRQKTGQEGREKEEVKNNAPIRGVVFFVQILLNKGNYWISPPILITKSINIFSC